MSDQLAPYLSTKKTPTGSTTESKIKTVHTIAMASFRVRREYGIGGSSERPAVAGVRIASGRGGEGPSARRKAETVTRDDRDGDL